MNKLKELKELLVKHVEELNEEKVMELAVKALDEGIEPFLLLEIINEGMNRVGKLYEQKDYYIADLIMAGIIFRDVLGLDKMAEHFKSDYNKKIGKVILGTVQGDIHDIGKDIFKGMLVANAFEVIDLGVDVPKEVFLQKVIENKPDIVGLSGVLTYTVDSMKRVVDTFQEAGIRDKVKIIAGASHITPETCKYIGADAFANDATVGNRICLQWMKKKNEQGEVNNE